MTKDQHSVAHNDSSYDGIAVNSTPATDAKLQKNKTHAKAKQASTTTVGKNLDGVSRKPITPKIQHQTQRNMQRSKTLMRSVVKKPIVPKSDRSLPKAKHELTPTPAEDSTPIIIKPQHIIHASGVTRSRLISKFGSAIHASNTAVVPVKSVPSDPKTKLAPDSPPITVAAPIVDSIDPIRQALENASGHIQPQHKKQSAYHRMARTLHVRPSSLTAIIVGVATVASASYFTYKNIPQIALRVASERTGIKASLPNYSPAGYSLRQPVQYDSSQVRLEYASNSDNRGFDIVQKASEWDSKSLLENYVIPSGHQYQKSQINGRTVYVLDTGDATWVDGGTWYEVKAKSSLSNDQLLKIVNGL